MYTISKGQNKFVAKTRIGLTQNLERLDSRKDSSRKSSDSDNGELITMPKPVFHSNGKKNLHKELEHNVITPQHEEIIKFISETWSQTSSNDSEPTTPTGSIVSENSTDTPSNLYYHIDKESPMLNGFQPFDLDTWWGKRIFQNITNSL